jgi:O-methyltransferase domain/Dimerisation domain
MSAKNTSTSQGAAPAPETGANSGRLFQLLSGLFASQCLGVVANLGVADVLANGPLHADDIAKKVGAHTDYLARVLRALSSIGVFTQERDGRFALTPVADLLRTDHPQSQRDIALTMMSDWNWSTWGQLLYSVRTGENASLKALGMPMFDYLREHPESEKAYSGAMRSNSIWQSVAVADAYPFDTLNTVIDVGGAHGHLLATVLDKHKNVQGVLFDQPQVVSAAMESGALAAPALRGRVSTVGGDFFESVPEGADGYLMKLVIHDWDDEKCIRILSNCKEAMAKGARILVVENVLKGPNEPDPAKFLDVLMLLGPGGRERTEEDFRALFSKAGLKLNRVVPTASNVSVLEVLAA